jgi:hypothetical protein
MKSNPQTVLAINPGTRYPGMAVFYGHQLQDWRTRVLKGSWSKGKLKKALLIASAWIEKYQPEILAKRDVQYLCSDEFSHKAKEAETSICSILAGSLRKCSIRSGLISKNFSIQTARSE